MDASTTNQTGVGMIHHPRDLAGVHEAVLAARAADANVAVRGGGTKQGWSAPPKSSAGSTVSTSRPLLTIDTRHMSGLVTHDPGDMTATVLAGTSLDDLRPQLEAAGQRLAVDPPGRGGGATVGGVVAANDAGPRRFRYGAMRDLVIGTTVVLADGTVSRSGGQVIKNVAGFDLGKLWCGSLGTLGVIAELTVRLHPLPEATTTVRVSASAREAASFIVDLLASPVECSAVEWAEPPKALLFELEGRAAGLAKQVDALAKLARRAGLTAEEADPNGPDVLERWRDAHAGGSGSDVTVARAATLPSQLANAVDALNQAAHGTEVGTAVHSHAGLGLHDAVLTGGSPDEQARVLAHWRARLAQLPGGGGTVVVREHREGVGEQVDTWGPMPQRLLDLMRDVKAALDPDGRMAPGRFVGGI